VKNTLISNHREVMENVNICTGGFRRVDLTLRPQPLMKLSDIPIDGERRYLGMWTNCSGLIKDVFFEKVMNWSLSVND
jgi:hypothetical protein